MEKPLIKVCGMRDSRNIRQVQALGVDFMGFIFYPHSPRCIGAETTVFRSADFPGKDNANRGAVEGVGVFVDESEAEVLRLTQKTNLGYVQLHGKETPAFCRRLRASGLKIIKAFSVSDAADLKDTGPYEPYCQYFIFDTKTPAHGGSGVAFDWRLLEAYRGETPFLLSGGIGPDHLDALRRFHHPRLAGYDLNSRFELEPGLKNVPVLADFLRRLQAKPIIDESYEL